MMAKRLNALIHEVFDSSRSVLRCLLLISSLGRLHGRLSTNERKVTRRKRFTRRDDGQSFLVPEQSNLPRR